MYLRRTTRRVGDKTYQNYLLVESVATPKGPRQRVICSLGALAPGAAETWRGTARRVGSARAARDGRKDAEPVGAAGRGTRHARLDPAHGAGRRPGHGLHRAQRRSAVSQSRPVASAARADRAGPGGPRTYAVQPGRHHLPLRPDVDVLRRTLPAQPAGQARLF